MGQTVQEFDINVEVGQTVRIIGGAFADYTGKLPEIDNNKVKMIIPNVWQWYSSRSKLWIKLLNCNPPAAGPTCEFCQLLKKTSWQDSKVGIIERATSSGPAGQSKTPPLRYGFESRTDYKKLQLVIVNKKAKNLLTEQSDCDIPI